MNDVIFKIIIFSPWIFWNLYFFEQSFIFQKNSKSLISKNNRK